MLALEGGGSKGAFAAGALHQLALQVSDLAYDSVSGVSAGAINSALFSLHLPGEEILVAE